MSKKYTLRQGHCPNGWTEPDITLYSIDGIDTAKGCAFALHEVAAFSSPTKIPFYSDLSPIADTNKRFIMHFDMQPMHLCMSFVEKAPVMGEEAWQSFFVAPDAEKNERLQMTVRLVEGNLLAKRFLAKPVVADIGKSIPCHWTNMKNSLECTCDVHSSLAMRAILQMAKYCCKSMVCELGFVITHSNRPAQVLGAVCIVNHDMFKYKRLDPSIFCC